MPATDLRHSDNMTALTTKDERFAALAATLSRAARTGDVAPADAGRVIRHELRKRNTNAALRATRRSAKAQAVIEHYGNDGKQVPKNGSLDALHSDHVFVVTAQDIQRLQTAEAWLKELPRFDKIVCVTAAENYALQVHERAGANGWDKYATAGVELV